MSSIADKSILFETPYTNSHRQWRSTLHEIKDLFIHRQYKRCVARCSSILASVKEPVHPVYKAYLYFYSALCYEATGQYAHEYSSKKVPLPVDYFGLAPGALPGPQPLPQPAKVEGEDADSEDGNEDAYRYTMALEDAFGEDMTVGSLVRPASISPSPSRTVSWSLSPSLSTAGSERERRSGSGSTSSVDTIVTSITKIIDKTLDSMGEDPFISDCEDIVDIDAEMSVGAGPTGDAIEACESITSTSTCDNESPSMHETGLLVPSPLRVRKSPSPAPNPLVFRIPSLEPSNGPSSPSRSPTPVQAQTQARNQGGNQGCKTFPGTFF